MKSNCIIAIVDDDEAIREALGDVLRSYGYESRAFSSAEDFLTYGERSSIDCILLDVKMPGLSGLELQEILRDSPISNRIVFMTSHQEDIIRDTAVNGGACAFLGKPVDMELLIGLLGRLLGNR
ncbi:FixJ family two-component response regulator [Phyllobacterium sp. 1468]|uniref:response regulator transcription factor n=1 Tax=Phyllobacterium sp. 1468 TaxID=2817759 RepID=UPI002860FA30|nr:response regulator [Phyllobacterium sp. 1468]MDR6632639.1 FixJ family two-component response regulator [Phyllobacterium sp. 1468]